MRRRRALVAGVALSGAVGAGVLLTAVAGVWPFSGEQRTTLRVMTFNVFYGGDDYDLEKDDWCDTTNGCVATLDKVVEAIEASAADVVGLEEGEGNTREIARRLGWYASPRTQIVSRYPLLEPSDADGAYVLVEVDPGKVVAVSSIHLPAEPYGPYAVRDGKPADAVVTLERDTRVPALTERLHALAGVLGTDIPVFLVGDFNSPSHLDWTADVPASRPEVRYALAWPVGAIAAQVGFRDSYREAHPDPVAAPGFTWTPGGPESVKDEVHDRIDWVLAAGPVETVASSIVGEPGYAGTDIAVDPFPSDHRAVVSTFSLEAADALPLVSLDERRLSVGETVSVRLTTAGAEGPRVAIVPRGADPGGAGEGAAPAAGAPVELGTTGLDPGPYDVVLSSSNGDELARAPFWLYPVGAVSEISVAGTSVASGDPVVVRFRGAPGNRWDWIGVFPATDADVATDGGIPDDSGDYVLYDYTRGEIEATVTLSERSFAGAKTWPLAPGRYEVRLMVDDGYQTIARSAPFTVSG